VGCGVRCQPPSHRNKSTVKVIGTIGMNSKDVDTLRNLLLAGMTVRCPLHYGGISPAVS
jgi:hypothetical protein